MKIFSFLLACVFSTSLFADEGELERSLYNLKKDFSGFVGISAKKELYVNYLAPQQGRPTVVLLNGLTYSTRQWDAMVGLLKKAGLGVLRYDMSGQGETLLKYKAQFTPYPYQQQVEELDQLLKVLKIPKPYHLVGLSYGGGIASAYSFKYGAKIKNLILMAPYTEPLEQQDVWIKSQISLVRFTFPFNAYSDDEIYDYYLRYICYTTYPMLEPVVLENQYKLEATFRMTQGIRHFQLLKQVDKFPKNSVHLVIAKEDQYIPREVLEKFWNLVPIEARASLTYVDKSEHKLPESVPQKSADIVNFIVSE